MPRVFLASYACLVLGACAEPCEEQPPIIEVRVAGLQDPSAPTLLALRGSAPEWATVLCDPEAALDLPGVPRWEGSCDLIAVELAASPEPPRLELQLVTRSAARGAGVLELPAGSCTTSIFPVDTKVEADDPAALDDSCEQACAPSCPGADPDQATCVQDCLSAADPSTGCATQARARAHCLAYLSCDWHFARAAGEATPCTPFDDALLECQST